MRTILFIFCFSLLAIKPSYGQIHTKRYKLLSVDSVIVEGLYIIHFKRFGKTYKVINPTILVDTVSTERYKLVIGKRYKLLLIETGNLRHGKINIHIGRLGFSSDTTTILEHGEPFYNSKNIVKDYYLK